MSRYFLWSVLLGVFSQITPLAAQTLHKINTLSFPTAELRHPHSFPQASFIVLNSDNGTTCQLYSPEGRLLSQEKYSRIDAPQHGLFFVVAALPGENIRCGYLDSTGRIVIPMEYDRGESLTYGQAAVRRPDGAFLLLDPTGKTTPLPGRYREVQTIAPGLFYAENEARKKGIILADGRVKVPFKYGQIRKLGEHDIYIILDGDWMSGDTREGLVDGQGKVLIPIGDQQLGIMGNCIHAAVSGVGDVYYDLAGHRITDPDFQPPRTGDDRYIYTEKVANVTRYGLLDSNFQGITPAVFDYIGGFTRYDLFAFTQRDGPKLRMGLLNRRGERILEQNGYADIMQLSPHDILVKLRRGKALWLDGSGRRLLPDTIPKLQAYFPGSVVNPEDTTRFAVLAVSLGGKKYGLYDRHGLAVTPEQYDTLSYLTRDRVIFRENGQYGVLDAHGRVLVPAQYGDILRFSQVSSVRWGLKAIVPVKNGRWGLLTMDGRELLPPEYEIGQILMPDPGHLWARRNKDWEIYLVK